MDSPDSNNEHIPAQTERARPNIRRPNSVTILMLGVLIITALNLTRLVLGIREWDFLVSWPGVSPLYIVLSGLAWTLAGIPLLYGLWRAKNWAPRLLQAVGLTYALYFWLDRVFLADHQVSGAEGARRALLPANWKFAAGATVISLAYIAWTLSRRKVKVYFDTHLPGNMNQDTRL